MATEVTAEDVYSSKHQVVLDREPTFCPVCKVAALPKRLRACKVDDHTIEVVYQCPGQSCQHIFIAGYWTMSSISKYYSLRRTFPNSFEQHATSKEVQGVSPTFSAIYNQALEAESIGLSEIAGMGFRKALEFLIKDYCISKEPTKADSIKNTLLGPCINNFVFEANIKACAERATWLGNDETHYTRQWVNHDIEDLKRLVRLTENWIANEVATAAYLAELQKPKK